MGKGDVHMILIIGCTLATNKIGAAIKHFAGFMHGICTPSTASIYCF